MEVIRRDFGRRVLGAAGAGEAFLNRMAVLADATAPGPGGEGRPRFAPSTLRCLERALVTRGADLRDAVYQLAHLLAAGARIAPSGRALDALFGYDGPVRATPVARHLGALAAGHDDVVPADGGLVVLSDAGARYRIAEARLPLLLALLDFALTAADAPEDMRAILDRIAVIEAAPRDPDAIRRASNAIAAALNARLDAMLRGRPERDRFDALAAFLEVEAEESGEPEFWRIDDDTILAFWCQQAEAPRPGLDFRQFRTVHRLFVALVLALRSGEEWERLRAPIRIDDSERVLEIPDGAGAEAAAEDPDPLDRLACPPCERVRFLTGAEVAQLQIPVKLWGAVGDFPLSVLRSEAMGAVQNAIANALRFGRPVAGLVALEEAPAYADCLARREKVRAHLARMLYAAVHVSAERRAIRLPEPKGTEARRAFRGIRRAGFAEAFEDAEAGAAFDAAVAPLSELTALMAGLARATPETAAGQEPADRATFARAFARLYPQEG